MKLCSRCHKREAAEGRKGCVRCIERERLAQQKATLKDPERRKRLWQSWYAKNRDRLRIYSREKMREYRYYYRYDGKTKQRAKKYGLTTGELRVLLESQKTCESCRQEFTQHGPTRAHIDHDHRTGVLRGVLCQSCNLALGHLHDSPELIARLLEYATKHVAVEGAA